MTSQHGCCDLSSTVEKSRVKQNSGQDVCASRAKNDRTPVAILERMSCMMWSERSGALETRRLYGRKMIRNFSINASSYETDMRPAQYLMTDSVVET